MEDVKLGRKILVYPKTGSLIILRSAPFYRVLIFFLIFFIGVYGLSVEVDGMLYARHAFLLFMD